MSAGMSMGPRYGRGSGMVDEQAHGGVERGSLAPHVRTYDGVIALLKWGAVAAVLIAALVIWLIAT